MKNAEMRAKFQNNIMYMKKIIFGILLHVAVLKLNIYQVLLTIQ